MADAVPVTPEEDLMRVDALLALLAHLRATDYRFITPTPATHARVNNRPLNALARRIEDVFGWNRTFARDAVPEAVFEWMRQAGILLADGDDWRSAIRVSSLGDQLFAHSAYPTTEQDAVFFGPDTYRFAQAIRHMLASRTQPVTRAVDIGCGAGPGAIVLAETYPAAEAWAVDINPAALRLTGVNAAANGTRNVVVCHSDLLTEAPGLFDVIVANPPYLVDPGERAYRHGGGPLGGALSLAIVATAIERLAPGGTLLLYTGVAIVRGKDIFLQEARPLLEQAGLTWTYAEMDPDVFGEELLGESYADTDRIAAVVLTATRPEV